MNGLNVYNGIDMGLYTQQNQFDLDVNKLTSLGFTMDEINTLSFIVMNGGKTSTTALTKYGLSYEAARRIRYMYDICIGKVSIESTDDLSKHLRKLFGKHRRIGIQDLAVSKISRVPRKAVVAGITDPTFEIYNSINYPVEERLYDVVNITPTRVVVETTRKPVLKYKQPKHIDGVLEILDVKADGKVTVAFDKRYCKLCNRYVVVASLRRPEFHHGLIEIICIEGTKVYVYARTLGTQEKVRYNMGTQRVYEYGNFAKEINDKLKTVGAKMYKSLCGVYATVHPANQDFRILTLEEDIDSDNDIVIED